MTDPDAPEGFDAVVLAGEYALGLLEGAELADARRRVLADPGFAAQAAYWDEHLAGLFAAQAGDSLHAPPAELWRAIDRRLAGDAPGGAVARLAERRPAAARWSWAAIASAAALAGVAVLLYVGTPDLRPADPAAPTQAPRQLIAQLNAEQGGAALTARIDPVTHRMAMKATKMDLALAGDMAPELWIIPAGGTPHSLGMIPANGAQQRVLTRAEATMAIEGATLAITVEPRQGAPHSAPSSAPVMAAALVEI
jgi:anti-sigma-K factor RskA